jgi:hypothetical protein
MISSIYLVEYLKLARVCLSHLTDSPLPCLRDFISVSPRSFRYFEAMCLITYFEPCTAVIHIVKHKHVCLRGQRYAAVSRGLTLKLSVEGYWAPHVCG